MKERIFLIAFLFLTSCSSQSHKEEAGDSTKGESQSQTTTTGVTAANSAAWVKLFTGTIGDYPVTMLLHKNSHAFYGYYYYHSKDQPLYFSGDDTTTAGTITAAAYYGNQQSEQFSFTLKGGTLSGSWSNGNSSQKLSVSLREATMPLAFQYHALIDSVALTHAVANPPSATYSAAAVWPAGTSTGDDVVKQEINRFFSENRSFQPVDSLLEENKKEFFSDYKEDNTNLSDSELTEQRLFYSYEASDNIMLCFLSPKLLSLAYLNFSYTGGAHGIYGTTFRSVDLVHNRPLMLADILSENGRNNLRTLLESNFRKEYGLKPGQPLKEGGLFDDAIEPSENFYVTDKGIGFTYNPYEIGPYAMGEIDIFIPFTDLANQLQPDFATLLS